MKRDQSGADDEEPHVFDQTNGVVDLGTEGSAPADGHGTRDRTVSGISMLSTQKP